MLARLSARSGWAKVKALRSAEAASRRGTNEGEAERRAVEAAGTTLTAHTMGRCRTGQGVEEFERREHPHSLRDLNAAPKCGALAEIK